MSTYQPSAKKFVQISEESLPPVYVPIVLDNEYYVMIQQDIRRMEDTRFLSLNKLFPTGHLYPLQPASADFFLQFFKKYNESANCQNKGLECHSQPMEISSSGSSSCAMAVEQQLKWEQCRITSAPFPFTYSRATSTTELCQSIAKSALQQQATCCSQCGSAKKVTFSAGTHTMQPKSAREQLKQKKMINSYFS